MENKITVALIYGSTRAGRFCDKVAAWVGKQISAKAEFALDIVDPAYPPARARESEEMYDTVWLRHHMGIADAFLVVTPEYNHGYPAGLKSLVDSVGAEWQAKPVAFVSYGGVSGGLRAVEQLRQVFAELHAVTIRDSVSFASAWEQFNADGTLKSPERAEKQMATVLQRLQWWAVVLRNGRNAIPYTPAA
ncbi:MAG TPA: NAD(P)H-dependent oxidoreductase [Candidatus Saccharimonadales bacterium]|nr:NAD(P)H-dependent oxidoreductase [Candidatus Saccharimonadales bacterium]